MSQFFSVYSLSLCSLTHPKCLGYDDEEELVIEKKMGTREKLAEPLLDRAISRSERRIELLQGSTKKESNDVRREKKPASVPFARLLGLREGASRFRRFLLRKRSVIAT